MAFPYRHSCKPIPYNIPPPLPADPACKKEKVVEEEIEEPPIPFSTYRYLQPAKTKPFIPPKICKPSEKLMESESMYRITFGPLKGFRPPAFKPLKASLTVGTGKMPDQTETSSSYVMYYDEKPPKPFVPAFIDHRGHGLMDLVSIQMKDYCDKPYSKPDIVTPKPAFRISDEKMSDKTSYGESHQEFDPRLTQIKRHRPTDAIRRPFGDIDYDSMYRASYKPLESLKRAEAPWGIPKKYKPPIQKMELRSTYMINYLPPGNYTECSPEDPRAVIFTDTSNEEDQERKKP